LNGGIKEKMALAYEEEWGEDNEEDTNNDEDEEDFPEEDYY
jgi:hypothetical protein